MAQTTTAACREIDRSGAPSKRSLSGGFGCDSDNPMVPTKIPTQGQQTALNGARLYPSTRSRIRLGRGFVLLICRNSVVCS